MTVGPDVKVEIDFDSVAFISTPTWTDVSADLMKISIDRGKSYEMGRMESGTAQVMLNNISGEYWPNTVGTYAGKILPMKKIRISATQNSVTYIVYTGYIESWNPDFIQDPDKVPVMNLSCVDAIKCFSRYYLNNAGYAQELSGTRVNNVLDDLGWPGIPVLKEYYDAPYTGGDAIYGVYWRSQTFTPTDDHPIGSVELQLNRIGNPATLIVSIKATDGSGHPTGDDLAIGYLNCNVVEIGFVTVDSNWHRIYFNDPTALSNGTQYAIVCRVTGGDSSNRISLMYDDSSPSYAGGNKESSSDAGSSWTASSGVDYKFKEYSANSRLIDAGQSYMQATGALEDVNALEHLFAVQDSENGNLFADSQGIIVFQDRAYRQTEKSSAGTVGDQAGDIFWNAVDISMDDYYINNDIRMTNNGGTQQIQQNQTSINTYGKRTFSKTGLLLTTDNECNLAAQYYLEKYKNAIQRVKTITLKPSVDNDYSLVLSSDISTYFQLKVTQASILEYYYIDGISHRWDAKEPQIWETKWELSDAANYQYYFPYKITIKPDAEINHTGNIGGNTANIYDNNTSTYFYIYSLGAINFSFANAVANFIYNSIINVNFIWLVSGGYANDNINTWITINAHDYAVHNVQAPSNAGANYFYYAFNANPNSNTNWNIDNLNTMAMGFKQLTTGGAIYAWEAWANVWIDRTW